MCTNDVCVECVITIVSIVQNTPPFPDLIQACQELVREVYSIQEEAKRQGK